MKLLAAVSLVALLGASPPPWQPRPVIHVDPRAYLASPTPAARPAKHARKPPARQPAPHRTAAAATETFERHDTAPSPRP